MACVSSSLTYRTRRQVRKGLSLLCLGTSGGFLGIMDIAYDEPNKETIEAIEAGNH